MNRNLKSLVFLALLLMVFAGCGGSGGVADVIGGDTGGIGSGGDTGGSGGDTVGATSVTLSWISPVRNEDGTLLYDLDGYNLYYGQSSGNLSQVVDVGNVNTHTVNNLTTGRWCFSVAAYDFAGNESTPSQEACSDI